MQADTVLKGKVFTSNRAEFTAQAVAIKDGIFVYVGDEAGVNEYVGPDTKVIEAGDGMFMPGFCDAHMHFSSGAGQFAYEIDIVGLETVDEYVDTIRKYVEEHPGREFYKGMGWDNAVFENEGKIQAKELLDAVCPDVPMLIGSYDGHSYWVNSKCLEKAGIGRGFVSQEAGTIVLDPETQEPTGLVRDWAMNDVFKAIRSYTVEEFKSAILTLQEDLLAVGITNIYEPILRDEVNAQIALEELDIEGKLKLKVTSGFYCKPEHEGLDKIDRCAKVRDSYRGEHYQCNNIKFVLDGVIESGTAYLLDDYTDKPGFRGVPNCEPDDYNAMVRYAKEKGFQVHVHAIGDAAISMALDGFEYAQATDPKDDWRPTITHLQVMRDEDIDRFAALKGIACANPTWHFKDPVCYESLEHAQLGERAESEYPLKKFWDRGMVVTSATDFPVSNPDPMEGLEVGVTRCAPGDASEETVLDPNQRVSVEDMICAGTINGAYQNFLEKRIGSIEVGKEADFVLMDRDITSIDPHTIHEAKCLMTVIDGKTMYEKEGE